MRKVKTTGGHQTFRGLDEKDMSPSIFRSTSENKIFEITEVVNKDYGKATMEEEKRNPFEDRKTLATLINEVHKENQERKQKSGLISLKQIQAKIDTRHLDEKILDYAPDQSQLKKKAHALEDRAVPTHSQYTLG